MANSVEVVAIGSELLAGLAINSNAAYLSRRLSELGFIVQRHTVLPDDEAILREGLSESLSCNALVIATGGLGPTCDDLTKNIAAELFDSEFHYDESVAKELTSRYGQLASIENQATVPIKAHLLKNALGTAPGLLFRDQRGTLIVLPGVPYEMKEMFEHEVEPLLKKHFTFEEPLFGEEIHFGNTYESKVDPYLRELKEEYPELQFGIYPRNGLLTVHVKGFDPKQIKEAAAAIKKQFASHQFLASSGLIEEAIHTLFKEKKLTLSVAESCTGGALSERLTSLPGASQFFLGGVVAYSNHFKTTELHVSPELIEQHGAVSQEVALEMANGVQALTGSDYSVAVTGIAGPDGGSETKPVGTVFFAIKHAKHPAQARQIRCFGSRAMIIEQAVNAILSTLYFSISS